MEIQVRKTRVSLRFGALIKDFEDCQRKPKLLTMYQMIPFMKFILKNPIHLSLSRSTGGLGCV